jgi:hypothetical protein
MPERCTFAFVKESPLGAAMITERGLLLIG